MALRVWSTTWLPLSQLVSVSIWFCAFAFLPLPQLGMLTDSAEGGCPCQKDGESSEKEVVFRSSARRRLNHRRHSDHSRPHETGDRIHLIASHVRPRLVIVGHQLANGLGAPLLI